jgi:hypothetical protein
VNNRLAATTTTANNNNNNNSYAWNVTLSKESAVIRNLKPELWVAPLGQKDNYREKEPEIRRDDDDDDKK